METSQERDDLLAIVADQRRNFLCTLDGITDKEAVVRTTVSELTLGGLVKHLGRTQRSWLAVIAGTAPAEFAMSDLDPDPYRMTESESLVELIDAFHAAAAEFDRAVRGEHDLDRRVTLPRYPWSPPVRSSGRSATSCCTSSGRSRTTAVTPTSSARPWTAPAPRHSWPRPRPRVPDGVKGTVSGVGTLTGRPPACSNVRGDRDFGPVRGRDDRLTVGV